MAPKKTTATAAKASRPTRAAASKAAVSAPAATTSKANGKKRAAADEVETTPAKKTAKARSNKAAAVEQDEEDAGDVNEREIIASLSDVSADSSDDDDASDINEEEANSSDEDDEDDRLATTTTAQPRSSLASVKLPNSKDDAVVRARLDKLRKSKSASTSATTPGVLYIGRLPKGFFEKQLKAYFSQFGDVTRLRVSRNKKTGASKHYAFLEFADRDVAAIVQETMHNYLIDGRLLQVKHVSKDKVHPELWVGANRKFAKVPGARLERVVRSRAKSEEEHKRTNERAIKRQDERRAKLASLGIEYEFEGYTTEDKANAAPGKAKATPAKTAKAKTAKA
ncbi:related to NOP15-protein involved in 60S ribosomal subunit biogenesis [Sporisorium reilianum f. sp. reilianum]|uniref:Related to NOP15-protein involved in 60S ribosomal subunit biogenesis n=1 Tax=Sporisorium reilianum f. sp. reilianum TaxID=72559 RepID=A0A2N8UHE1_9BASI|nr:related to NOP15-protein involved in 60S ribosomal subunit biogenesis [Sporisorium reilianum f. sp. reilianum]